MRQVGEQRAVERDAVHAALGEAVRRHFHRHRARALRRSNRSSSRLQLERIGRGVATASRRAPGKPVPSVPITPARAPRRVERRRDPLAARGLAVGAGDAAHPERAPTAGRRTRAASAPARCFSSRTATFGTRHSPRQAKPSLSHSTAAAPRPTRVGDVARPSAFSPGIGEERDARARSGGCRTTSALDHRALRGQALRIGVHRLRVTCSPSPRRLRRAGRAARAARRAARRAGAARPASPARTPAPRPRRRSTAPAAGSSIITATTRRGADAGARPTNEARYLSAA